MNNSVFTNDEIMLAAGVTADEIASIKTANATTAANFLEAIHDTLISYVHSMAVEYANLSNPLSVFEKSYAEHNNGSLNGMFEEILVPTRDAGTNGLYAGSAYTPGAPTDPWTAIDFGKAPLSKIFKINAKIKRHLNWDREDFLMALNNNALPNYLAAKKATMIQEGYGARYNIENNVLNCERFQYKDYSAVPVHTDASELDSWIHKVWTSQKYNGTNTEFKRVPFNTTRGISRLFFILEEEFWFDYAKNFQLKEFLQPFVWRREDSDEFGTEVTAENTVVKVDKLTPTTLAANQILNPLNMTAATLPANTKLVGRIVDWNAIKFGMGVRRPLNIPLDPNTYDEQVIEQYCFDMSEAYINVPILISTNSFDSHRKFHIIDDTPATPSIAAAKTASK